MISKLLKVSLAAAPTAAKWGFFQCSNIIEGMSDFDATAFKGTWYEVTKDSTLRTWSNVECSTDVYSASSNGMEMQRDFERGIAIFKPKSGVMTADITLTPTTSGNGVAEWTSDGEKKARQHNIIATNYADWAIVYGCDDYWGGLWHVSWATFLSRTKHVSASSWIAARQSAEDLGYDASNNWDSPDTDCGFSKDATPDDSFIALLETEPDWRNDWYKNDIFLNTVEAMFSPTYPEIPAGFMVGEEFEIDGRKISTNFKEKIKDSNY